MEFLTVAVRAKPGSSKTHVGGAYGDPPQLIVSVGAPAVDGKANQAVREALAQAFDVPTRHVELIGGDSARSKRFRIHGDLDDLQARLGALLAPADAPQPRQSDLFD